MCERCGHHSMNEQMNVEESMNSYEIKLAFGLHSCLNFVLRSRWGSVKIWESVKTVSFV